MSLSGSGIFCWSLFDIFALCGLLGGVYLPGTIEKIVLDLKV